MKTKLHTINTFKNTDAESIKKAVTAKIEKLINQQTKHVSSINRLEASKKTA